MLKCETSQLDKQKNITLQGEYLSVCKILSVHLKSLNHPPTRFQIKNCMNGYRLA